MTSVIRITFRGLKDFDVEIDSIESISPRGLELAFAKIEKLYREIKGHNLFNQKQANRESVKAKQETNNKVTAIAKIEAEELSKYRSKVRKAAEKIYNNLETDQQERVVSLSLIEAALKTKADFLEHIEDKIEAFTGSSNFDSTIDPVDVADKVLDELEGAENSLDGVNKDIENAEATLEGLEASKPDPEPTDDTDTVIDLNPDEATDS